MSAIDRYVVLVRDYGICGVRLTCLNLNAPHKHRIIYTNETQPSWHRQHHHTFHNIKYWDADHGLPSINNMFFSFFSFPVCLDICQIVAVPMLSPKMSVCVCVWVCGWVGVWVCGGGGHLSPCPHWLRHWLHFSKPRKYLLCFSPSSKHFYLDLTFWPSISLS